MAGIYNGMPLSAMSFYYAIPLRVIVTMQCADDNVEPVDSANRGAFHFALFRMKLMNIGRPEKIYFIEIIWCNYKMNHNNNNTFPKVIFVFRIT